MNSSASVAVELTPERKLAGILAPLFALRTERDLGIGDVGALREFVDWAADAGFRVVQLLPINETGNDNSPYNAISSVALDPMTIDLHQMEDLAIDDLARLTAGTDLDILRGGPVAYPLVKSLKWTLLRRAYDCFQRNAFRKSNQRARAFRNFCVAQQGWLEPYAFFHVFMEENAGSERWDAWQEEHQTPYRARVWVSRQAPEKRRRVERELRFRRYVQWIAWTQWIEVRSHAESRGVALMGDVPFGVSYYSADVWAEPDVFDHRWSGGAPPEPLFTDDAFTQKWGQNWGVPLYRWSTMRQNGFAWWRQRVGRVRDIFHLFRIDHILGFYRIYGFPWRPQLNAEFLPLTRAEALERTGGELPRFHEHDDETPEGKAANRQHGEELLRILLEETGQHRLIGEDLGVVPDYVRPSLASLDIPGFKIPIWETNADGTLTKGEEYPRLSITTFGTHDHEPLRGYWDRRMAAIEAAESGDPKLAPSRDEAWRELRMLASWAGFEVPCITPFDDTVHERLLGALFAANSWLAVAMITDLFATSQRFNVPGAVSESNWSQRLAHTISDWRNDPELVARMQRIRKLIETNARI